MEVVSPADVKQEKYNATQTQTRDNSRVTVRRMHHHHLLIMFKGWQLHAFSP